MPRFARLFDSAEDIVEAYRDALVARDAEGALRLWLDEDSITCVMPDGHRLIGMNSCAPPTRSCWRSNRCWST